jgi:hypothetical protein
MTILLLHTVFNLFYCFKREFNPPRYHDLLLLTAETFTDASKDVCGFAANVRNDFIE